MAAAVAGAVADIDELRPRNPAHRSGFDAAGGAALGAGAAMIGGAQHAAKLIVATLLGVVVEPRVFVSSAGAARILAAPLQEAGRVDAHLPGFDVSRETPQKLQFGSDGRFNRPKIAGPHLLEAAPGERGVGQVQSLDCVLSASIPQRTRNLAALRLLCQKQQVSMGALHGGFSARFHIGEWHETPAENELARSAGELE